MKKLVYSDAVEYETPDSLSALAGPASGSIEFPRTLYWGPERTVDLADAVDTQRMYQAVVRIGTSTEQAQWLNREVLAAMWANLVLPVRCVAVWEAKFPELAAR